MIALKAVSLLLLAVRQPLSVAPNAVEVRRTKGDYVIGQPVCLTFRVHAQTSQPVNWQLSDRLVAKFPGAIFLRATTTLPTQDTAQHQLFFTFRQATTCVMGPFPILVQVGPTRTDTLYAQKIAVHFANAFLPNSLHPLKPAQAPWSEWRGAWPYGLGLFSVVLAGMGSLVLLRWNRKQAPAASSALGTPAVLHDLFLLQAQLASAACPDAEVAEKVQALIARFFLATYAASTLAARNGQELLTLDAFPLPEEVQVTAAILVGILEKMKFSAAQTSPFQQALLLDQAKEVVNSTRLAAKENSSVV